MLYALTFIVLFSIGGLTGLIQGALSLNLQVHDTAFVVGHFHYVMFGGAGMAFFGGLHHWFPKMFGRMVNRKGATLAWAVLFVGFNLLYFPMLVMGWMGMPRRYYDYLPRFHAYHALSTVGSWILVTGLLLMLGNLVVSLRRGERAPVDPWGGSTLEWRTSSPPPVENFEEEPDPGDPYDFSEVRAREGTA
jgi:cytochrome c oxidase subunit 1